jgi:hypothetical protein
MIQATARILRNVIEVRVGDAVWLGRPIEAEQGGIAGRIVALFSTEYHLYRPDDPTVVESTVSYRAKNDEIRIQVGDESWKTCSSTFGPMTIDYGGATYTIHERLTGRFAILLGATPVAVGQLGYRSCVVRDYRPELERFLTHLALGYVVRTLTWEMFYS